jgi:hypothetical protein
MTATEDVAAAAFVAGGVGPAAIALPPTVSVDLTALVEDRLGNPRFT